MIVPTYHNIIPQVFDYFHVIFKYFSKITHL